MGTNEKVKPCYHRVIHWFRRDLRLTDNTALTAAIKSSAEVVPVYVLSTWKKHHPWTGPGRQDFLIGCLNSLRLNLDAIGGRLIFRSGPAVDTLERLIMETRAEAVFFNRDPDPFGIQVETDLRQRCRHHGIAVHDFKDVALHERSEILTQSGTPYRVYTPYSRAWRAAPKPPPLPRPKFIVTPKDIPSLEPPTLAHWDLTEPSLINRREPGENAARKRLANAIHKGIPSYESSRNTPGDSTTSRLGADLRYGLLSARELFAKVMRASETTDSAASKRSYFVFINELAWREFYMQILWHFPEVLYQEFNPVYRNLPWERDANAFQRWSEGMTGFPIVDAGMRQLKATGFMHNRARMITAMFLTKDLRIDWREGEKLFHYHLIDGEIASNNGGWQWSAGTGADAAPYFRIQNPWTQSRRYDPDGSYIRKWIPELGDTPAKALHAEGDTSLRAVNGYPAPMVNHSEQRNITLDWFNQHRITPH